MKLLINFGHLMDGGHKMATMNIGELIDLYIYQKKELLADHMISTLD